MLFTTIRSFALPFLFAGKLHALLFRKWGINVKGRDWWDLEWYIKQGIPVERAVCKGNIHWSIAARIPGEVYAVKNIRFFYDCPAAVVSKYLGYQAAQKKISTSDLERSIVPLLCPCFTEDKSPPSAPPVEKLHGIN